MSFILFCNFAGMRATAAGEDAVEYRALVNHAVNLANTLLFIYFIAVLLIEIRHLQPQFYIRVSAFHELLNSCYIILSPFLPSILL